ncbi:hypothetical protein [Phormidium sp. CCY1219]|uniref:hypothetical protein n=1 Tax=Phormidium sp. CCY1219 TaxID=2886104 RepID=UPI002D1F2A60|nr:hypothetical protein [Phormidium sp. CCY1219]MEB3827846.1 hypothetical protein [Phormidium sp. CCY1219]
MTFKQLAIAPPPRTNPHRDRNLPTRRPSEERDRSQPASTNRQSPTRNNQPKKKPLPGTGKDLHSIERSRS